MEDEEDEFTNLSPDSKKKYIIKNTPVTNSKYLHIWKRLRAKISIKRAMGQLSSDLEMYGTSLNIGEGE